MRADRPIWPLTCTGDGGLIPRGYGIAWYCPDRHAAVCAPVPLNVLLAWLRRVYAALAAKAAPDRIERAYDHGYADGRDEEQAHWERLIEHLHRDHVVILTREITLAEQRGRRAVIDDLFADLNTGRLTQH
jgi:hypothetical protein